MTNINVNTNEINNSQSQTGQQLPSHQLNTNLTNCNIPPNYIDTTQEDTFLESMEIHWIIELNILNLRIHQFIHVCVVIDYA
jgi:hypothetical protein